MKKSYGLIVLLLCAFSTMSAAMGQQPEKGAGAMSSALSSEMERQVKTEYDSLTAIYDPWKAIKGDKAQNENLKKAGASKRDILESLKGLDQKYPHSAIGDMVLQQMVMLHVNLKPQKDTIDGPLPAKPNPRYRDYYYESIRYALKLADEYPNSTYAEKMLLYVGIQYAGGLEEKDGKYIKPYVEFVKRYPKSRFMSFALYVISESAELDTGLYVADFETRMWAYSLWRKKYDDEMFYFNYIDDPKYETTFNNPKIKNQLKEEMDKEKQEVGKHLLNIIATSIGHSLSGFWGNNPSIVELNTNDANKIYKLLSPYCRETDVFKKMNPFEKYPDIKIKHFYANREKYNYILKLLDVELDCSADRTVPKPKRR